MSFLERCWKMIETIDSILERLEGYYREDD